MEKLKPEVISNIRACLVSSKGKVSLRQLDGDYRTIVGERIPYSQLGYKRLEELIQDEPTLVLTKSNGEFFVDAKVSEKSSHITEMVMKQKTSKKPIPKAVRFNVNYNQSAPTTKWRPKDVNYKYKKYHTSSRPAAVSHNQFVNHSNYKQPSVASKVVIPEKSSYNNHGYNHNNHASKKHDGGECASKISDRLVMKSGQSISVIRNSPVEQSNNKVEAPSDVNILTSTKKRLAKKMSQLNLDRDSGNSSPTSEIISNSSGNSTTSVSNSSPLSAPILPTAPSTPAQFTFNNPLPTTPTSPSQPKESPVVEFTRTDDAIADLKKFVELHKIGEINTSTVQVKSKQKFFTCKIKVGNKIYSSYPQEFADQVSAEKYCANEALKDLMPQYSRRKSLLLASFKDILDKIPPMLEKHPHGIWGWQLELDYADKYQEQLPSDWLKVIDSSPCIQVEKCSDKYVLRHCKPGDKGQKWNTSMNVTDVSVPANTVDFPENGKLYAQATCILSANELWFNQVNTPECVQFSEMITRMETYYTAHHRELKAHTVNVERYYVAKYDNNWYRIRAVEVNDTEILCFFIDFGDETVIQIDSIFTLKREFATSQAQAFVCRLVGLEELYEVSVASEILQNYLFKHFILESANVNLDENTLPIYMYDVDSGASINEELIPRLTMESASPVLVRDTIAEVYVSNIESNGDVYVQLHSPGYDSLQDMLHNLEVQILQSPSKHILGPVTKENSKNRLYFAKYKADGHWYRIKIIDWAPQGELAQIYFVDYGNADVINVNVETLYPLDKLNDVINQYPFQAVKVRMSLETIPNDFVELATKLMPLEHPVLLKIVDYDNASVPWVEFFKRNTDGGLFCINKSIAIESELKKGDGNNNLKATKRKMSSFTNIVAGENGVSKNVPSGGSLQRPILPKKGQYFEVHIPFAVNPFNFFVQPLESKNSLNNMMLKLQERFKDVQYSPLQLTDIIPGQIYASKHEDGFWYRTSVIKVIHSGSISVFYCDFGYYANLTVQQLIPLDREFMELPYQALKGKLSRIKPIKNKWTVEDCEYFKELVMRKSFISVLTEIEKDELYESDIVLNLIIFDTSSDEDINIETELIKKGIAVSVV